MEHNFFLVATRWGSRIERYADVARLIDEYLKILRSMHPEFAAWQLYMPGGGVSAACETWAEITQHWDAAYSIVEEDIRDDLDDLGPDGELVGDTWSRYGFSLNLFSVAPGTPAGDVWREDRVMLAIDVGGSSSNGIEIEIPATLGGARNYALMRRLLLATAAHWMGDLAEVRVPGFLTAVLDGRTSRNSELNAEWLTCIRNPYLAASIAPIDACDVEVLGDDGVLFSLSEHVPDPSNPADVARGRAVQSWLDGFHFHHAWTVTGWPYDPADGLYAQQITGAPEGAVYAVGFVPFDGYDSVRKVVLFTRLFRLLDRHGLELDPAYRDDRGKLESLPFVVLARQHIAAVRYVGATNPIEWHVGIEQKAQALKVLLNGWAGIPEEQLRVVYTPFDGELPPIHGG